MAGEARWQVQARRAAMVVRRGRGASGPLGGRRIFGAVCSGGSGEGVCRPRPTTVADSTVDRATAGFEVDLT